ncbi:hypothetical protein HRH25_15120 [Flavisolibacter sp. BT320]|nr:hypothetical protein [Flavisolibacter longurius]
MVRVLFLVLLLVPNMHFGQFTFTLADSLNRFAAEIVMAECGQGICNGAGYVKISEKSGNVFLQTIHFKDQVLLYPAEMQLKEGGPASVYKQAPLRFVDFDFDGYSDLLLASRRTLLFYQYRKDAKRFELQPLHKRLKSVAITGAGVDTVTKRLVVRYTASDRDVREEYQWDGSKPQHVFSLSVRERTVGFVAGDQRIHMPLPPGVKPSEEKIRKTNSTNKKVTVVLIVVKEERMNGRWRKTSRRFTPEEYKRAENAAWKL